MDQELAAGRAAWRRGAWTAFGLVVLVLVSLALRPDPRVADVPFLEDGYYAFTVSDNLAAGDGLTIDGEHLTNGFQPLFTIVSAPLFLAGDELALRLVMLAQVALYVAAGLLLGRIVASARGPALGGREGVVVPLVAVLFLSAAFLMRTSANGLETGALLFMYVLWWRRYQLRGMATVRDAAALGVVAGLTVLTRIDATFVVALFAAATVLWAADRREALRRAAAFAGVAALVSAPWWLYNTLAFGSPMPTSGSAQTEWRFEVGRFGELFGALAQAASPWFYLGVRFQPAWPVAAVVAVAAGGVWWFLLRGQGEPPAPEDPQQLRRADRFAQVLVVGGGLLATYYVASSWATHFYPRYLALLALPALYLWSRFVLSFTARWPKLGVLGIAAIMLVGTVQVLILWTEEGPNGNPMLRDQVPLVERTVPAGELVAAGQSGTLGFYRDGVVNLDGKVNPDAYEAREHMAAYLAEQGVTWLCDWDGYVQSYVGEDPEAAGWVEVDREGDFGCWHLESRSSGRRSTWLWGGGR
jgi:hypothetical protein